MLLLAGGLSTFSTGGRHRLDARTERPEQFERKILVYPDQIALVNECVGRKGGLSEDVAVDHGARGVSQCGRSVCPTTSEVKREPAVAIGWRIHVARWAMSAAVEA